MVRETCVRSQVESNQRLKKWYLIPPCLTLSNIRHVSRVKWGNPGKGVAPSPTPRCSSYWKGGLLVALDYVHIYIYVCVCVCVKLVWHSVINNSWYATKPNQTKERTKGKSVKSWMFFNEIIRYEPFHVHENSQHELIQWALRSEVFHCRCVSMSHSVFSTQACRSKAKFSLFANIFWLKHAIP